MSPVARRLSDRAPYFIASLITAALHKLNDDVPRVKGSTAPAIIPSNMAAATEDSNSAERMCESVSSSSVHSSLKFVECFFSYRVIRMLSEYDPVFCSKLLSYRSRYGYDASGYLVHYD